MIGRGGIEWTLSGSTGGCSQGESLLALPYLNVNQNDSFAMALGGHHYKIMVILT